MSEHTFIPPFALPPHVVCNNAAAPAPHELWMFTDLDAESPAHGGTFAVYGRDATAEAVRDAWRAQRERFASRPQLPPLQTPVFPCR
jgi:hypothetical protein